MSVFETLVNQFNGEVTGIFRQTDFLKSLPPEHQRGACMALSSIWGSFRCDANAFIYFTATNEGRSVIQGIYNYLFQLYQTLSKDGVLYSGYVKKTWAMLRITPFPIDKSGDDFQVPLFTRFLISQTQFVQLHICTKDATSVHAMAAYHSESERIVHFYDPNEGMCKFSTRTDFHNFLKSYMAHYYHAYFGGQWVCISGTRPKKVPDFMAKAQL